MDLNEILDRIQRDTDLDRDAALELSKVVVGTLGERLYRTEARQAATQLPRPLREAWTSVVPPEQSQMQVDRFDAEEFRERVRARANLNVSESNRYLPVVMATLEAAISPGEWADITKELGSDYDELFNPVGA